MMDKANHKEAIQLAGMKTQESNLARAYMEVINVLTNMTHHEGGMEEYKPVWLPIVETYINTGFPPEKSTFLKDTFLEIEAKKRHEHLMATDEKYAERFMELTVTPGRRITVVMDCVKREGSEALLSSMFSKDELPELVAGCRVNSIAYYDLADHYKKLQSSLTNLLEVHKNGTV